MGQAKQRGTFEQRRLESQHAEALRMEARRVQIEAAKERRRLEELARPAPEPAGPRKPPTHSAFGRRSPMMRSTLMAAAALALALPTEKP